jgi:hypothetical protein
VKISTSEATVNMARTSRLGMKSMTPLRYGCRLPATG